MPRATNSGLSFPSLVMKVGDISHSWYSMSVSPRWKASQRLCVSSMMLISTPSIAGSFLPCMRSAICLKRGLSPASKFQVMGRKPGFVASSILEERT